MNTNDKWWSYFFKEAASVVLIAIASIAIVLTIFFMLGFLEGMK